MSERGGEVRGTQSFVRTLTSVWGRPRLTALEVAWRWVFGVPALWLVISHARRVLLAATGGTMEMARLGLDHALLIDPVGALTADPMGAAGKFAGALRAVLPGIRHEVLLLGPPLFLGWVLFSSVGRMFVLATAFSREEPIKAPVVPMLLLQGLRALVLGAVVWLWLALLGAVGSSVLTGPIGRGEEPNLVLYCGLVIVISIAMFTGWAAVSWPLQVAPVLAMGEGLGVVGSLREAAGLGAVRGKLVEVNLVMGIVKIALLVLAMVFSATPLPFQDVATAEFLAWWWAGVGVLWLLWSDFFHVVRLVSYVDLWRAFDSKE